MGASSVDDVLERLEAGVGAAALGAAMELGLFWLLADGPRALGDLARALGMAAPRCDTWLRLLERDGYLERDDSTAASGGDARIGLAPAARAAILQSYTAATWGLLAQEARERRRALGDLPRQLCATGPAWPEPDYVGKMAGDPARAERFCRMLWELHQGLAERVAASLDLGDATRLLDLGGGSGVVAAALARRHEALEITVLDIATVCAAGRTLVAEAGLTGRVSFVEGDLREGPAGARFDLALECDVGVYDAAVLRRAREALVPGGRFVIVDQLPEDRLQARAHPSWGLERVLRDPEDRPTTIIDLVAALADTGFVEVRSGRLGGGRDRGRGEDRGPEAGAFADSWVLVEARVP